MIQQLIDFIHKSPTAYHAVENLCSELDACGFEVLHESEPYHLIPGGKYYVTRGQSSLIAFQIPSVKPKSFLITASHSDSPMFKLKCCSEQICLANYTKLNIERYGGMILSSWLDRPLSVAGRVVVRSEKNDPSGCRRLISKTVCIDRDLAVIPNVCIHFNRQINDGFKYNPQVDLLPLIGDGSDSGKLMQEIAEQADVSVNDIVASDLFLYNRMNGVRFGLENEFFAAPRIDNLECALGTFRGFLDSHSAEGTLPIYALFDNEETGSTSRQGAASTFLSDTLFRIGGALGMSHADTLRTIASSMMVSADNAHAKHPNHPELSDADNAPFMNRGIVIKYNAAQHYTTDAISEALFVEMMKNADIPVQPFANRSDVGGGSTLGNISETQISLPTVDIGMAQLAMHSSYESAGCLDFDYLTRGAKAFYESEIYQDADGQFTLKTKERS